MADLTGSQVRSESLFPVGAKVSAGRSRTEPRGPSWLPDTPPCVNERGLVWAFKAWPREPLKGASRNTQMLALQDSLFSEGGELCFFPSPARRHSSAGDLLERDSGSGCGAEVTFFQWDIGRWLQEASRDR